MANDAFRALVVDKPDTETTVRLEHWTSDRLMPGEVLIRVEFSSVNYKDGLATRADGNVARIYPLIPGIDLAGTVAESSDPRFSPGDAVLVHGYELGVAHHGGFAELARVPTQWVVPLPAGLNARQAMAVGTAGFTAALSLETLERMGLRPASGRVLVTGASGGLGSTAVSMLAARGYEVFASTGSMESHAYLRSLGAVEVIDRSETSAESGKPLEKARWAGAIDSVGGSTLAYLLRTMSHGGCVAVCGNTAGAWFTSTVFPFILRAVNVLGIESAQMPIEQRTALWQRIASDLRPPHLEDAITGEISLDELPDTLSAILRGETRGRIVVRLAEER